MKKYILKIYGLITDPTKRFFFLSHHGFYNLMSDERYLKKRWKIEFGKELDLDNPRTFNEKLQWLKLYNRKDIYTIMADKYEAKKYVGSIIGDEYIIPTLGIYDRFDDIDFNRLPNQFVIKCTHDSGGVIIVKDKSKFKIDQSRKKINKLLRRNFYWRGREWPYKNIKPRIIIEKYMEDKNDKELRDYKLFCFNGKFKMLFIATNRQGEGEVCFDFFDHNFKHLPFTNGHPHAQVKPHKPKNLQKMIELAEKLSEDIPQIRIDFYETNGKIYFGEITFYHFSGFTKFEPEEWDKKLGDMINLRKKKMT